MHEVAHEIFDVAADIARLAKLGRIRLDEGNPNQIGDMFDQIVFPTPVGPTRMTFCLAYSVSSARSASSFSSRRK